jgi:hypothetical protein
MSKVVDAKAGDAGGPSDRQPGATEVAGLDRCTEPGGEDEIAIAI